MDSKTSLGLNNPIPYIFIAFILSSFFYKTYNNSKLLAIVIVGGFLCLLSFYKGIAISALILMFFILGIFNNIIFYDYEPHEIDKIRIDEIKSYYIKGKINGRYVYLNIEEDYDVSVGDRILAKGKFVKGIDNGKGIIGEYNVYEYKALEDDFIKRLYDRREELYNLIRERLGERKAGLITSVSFGYSQKLDSEDRTDMKSFGISHAVAVSGLHMAIVYGALKRIFGYKISLLLSFVYVLFTGASASTIRAYIMIFIMNFAVVVKRNYNPLASISLAGIILLIIRPYDLFSVGFVLSFLATLGIILFNKKLNRVLYRLPEFIRKAVSVSIAAQIFTVPVLIYEFNELSMNFLLGNLVILPIINILVLLGNSIVLVYNIAPIFNYVLFLCYSCIKLIDRLMDIMWSYKVDIIYMNYLTAFFYSILIITFYFYRKGFKKFIILPTIALVYLFIIYYSPVPSIRYYNEGAFLISYMGEKVLIQTKSMVDKAMLKKVTKAEVIFKDFSQIRLNNELIITKEGKNYIIKTAKKQYALIVNKGKINNEYDIIDFSTGELQEVIIFNKKVISR